MQRLFLLVVAALKFGKLVPTVATMLLAIGVYALAYGWRYAAGIVAMLFLHEMGHYIAARQRGLAVRLPMFIPFLFAWTTLEDMPHDAETAERWGMIWKVVDDASLANEAEALAARLVRSPAGALAGIKQLFGAASGSLDAQLDLEARFQGEAGRSADFVEGVNAFQNKRPPRFS